MNFGPDVTKRLHLETFHNRIGAAISCHLLLEVSLSREVDVGIKGVMSLKFFRIAVSRTTTIVRIGLSAAISAAKDFYESLEPWNESFGPTPSDENAPANVIRYSLRDPLTQLPNRSALIHRLDDVIDLTIDSGEARFALLCIDMDRFKIMNESLGHALGDQFLSDAAQRLGRLIGLRDTLARLGGDKFAIILVGHSAGELIDRSRELAKDIQAELARPVILGRREVYASASIGIAVGRHEYRKSEEPLRDAEIAMYRAKELGRGRFELFDSELDVEARKRLELEMDLRHALDHHEFELVYQPIVSTGTGKIAAFEALLRWRHPSRGLLTPGDFLQLLHDTSLIIPVGRWVIAEVCRQMGEWQREVGRPIPVSFNLSAREFAEPGIVAAIEHAIEEAGVDPSAVTVEITEDALIGRAADVTQTIRSLTQIGIKLLIDDFGTGYSSLSYLAELPAHGLKIPRELVWRIDQRTQDRAIVEAIFALANVLELGVVAEGVENVTQLGELRELDCQHIQGYLISKPVNAATARKMLLHNWKFCVVTGMSTEEIAIDPSQLELMRA